MVTSSIQANGPQKRAASRRHAGTGCSSTVFGPPTASRRAASSRSRPSGWAGTGRSPAIVINATY